MWEAFRARAEERGVEVQLNHRVAAIQHEHEVVHSLTIEIDVRSRDVGVDGVLSSIPLSDLVLSLEPAVPAEIRDAAEILRYRGCVSSRSSSTTTSRSRTTGSTGSPRSRGRHARGARGRLRTSGRRFRKKGRTRSVARTRSSTCPSRTRESSSRSISSSSRFTAR